MYIWYTVSITLSLDKPSCYAVYLSYPCSVHGMKCAFFKGFIIFISTEMREKLCTSPFFSVFFAWRLFGTGTNINIRARTCVRLPMSKFSEYFDWMRAVKMNELQFTLSLSLPLPLTPSPSSLEGTSFYCLFRIFIHFKPLTIVASTDADATMTTERTLFNINIYTPRTIKMCYSRGWWHSNQQKKRRIVNETEKRNKNFRHMITVHKKKESEVFFSSFSHVYGITYSQHPAHML